MAFILSPSMNLPIPGVGTQFGPQYAFNINDSLTLIDGHDHSPGRGVQITPAGININVDLPLNGNNLTSVNDVVFLSQSSSSLLQAIYVKPGTETPAIQDLWYNDSAGNPVQLTAGGLVNATIASIPGESFAGGTFFWKQGAGSTVPANFDIGSITLRPNIALTTNGIVLSPPVAIASQYDIVLPLLPSVPSFLQIDNAGNITATQSVTPLTPDNAGAQGYFLRQNASSGFTWQTLDSTIAVVTTTYAIRAIDDIVQASGSALTATLPTAVGRQGKEYTLTKTDASLTNIITWKGAGSETIGSFGNSVTSNTQNETWIIYSDNVNWQVKSHSTATKTIVDTNVIVSTGSFGTTTIKEWRWHREGQYMVGQLIVQQPTVGGTNGSGEYHLTVPSGQSIDTTIAPASTTSNQFIAVAASALDSSCNVLVNGGSLPQLIGQLCVVDSTHVRMIGAYYNSGVTFVESSEVWQAGTAGLGNPAFGLVFSFRAPILGWLP